MAQHLIEQHIKEQLPKVSTAAHLGYLFYFYATDQVLPFATIAIADHEGDADSQLDREGVYRVNIGILKTSFERLFPQPEAVYDYAALNQLMPHPHYAAQHYVCVLNPEDRVLTATLQLINEAYELARSRFERKQARKANDAAAG